MAAHTEPNLDTQQSPPVTDIDNNEIEALPSSALSELPPERFSMTRPQAWNLYISHSISTWNIRTYEFAAVLFTASAYPNTLIATSIRMIIKTLASICFSSMLGRWIDKSPSRLKTLLSTIVVNRASVIAASILWICIIEPKSEKNPLHNISQTIPGWIPKDVIFAMIIVFGVLESLSGSANMISMERDWVVTAAAKAGNPYDLTQLNSTMRRIDLICKLIAPILISTVISVTSIQTGLYVVGVMSLISFPIEWLCARHVWSLNPQLQQPKHSPIETSSEMTTVQRKSLSSKLINGLKQYLEDFKDYFSSTVWGPSLALSLLHISALAYSPTLITFLLNAGFSLELITIARAFGSVVEISSTVVTPVGVQYLSKAKNHGRFYGQDNIDETLTVSLLDNSSIDERAVEVGLERLGLWGVSWQLLNLVPVLIALWSMVSNKDPLPIFVFRAFTASQTSIAFILFFFLSMSRLGLWIFDLTTQQLTQTMTTPSQRSTFTGVEYSFVSLFELAQNVFAITLHRPEQFKWIALMSWSAVFLSTLIYAIWVWKMRGHLIHWERLSKSCECVKLTRGQNRRC